MTVTSNAPQIAADLIALAAATEARVRSTVTRFGAILQGAVKANAKTPRTVPRPGPGGPRLLTGDYNRSINRRTTHTPTISTAEVGTDAPQAARLEFGFHGTDSLGRTYDQKAYEHFGPAMDTVGPKFEGAVAAAAIPRPGE